MSTQSLRRRPILKLAIAAVLLACLLGALAVLAACTPRAQQPTVPAAPKATIAAATIPTIYPDEWFGALRQELIDAGFQKIQFVGDVDVMTVCSRTANQACRDLLVLDVADQGQRVPVTQPVTITVEQPAGAR